MNANAMFRAIVLCILAMSLTLTACKKEDPKTDPPKTDPPKTTPETPKVDPPKEDPPKEDPPKEDPPKAEVKVDENMFISAFYEVTCVQAKITDAEKQKEIIAEILPRYGFDQASFDAAKTKLSAAPNVGIALKSKMEGCKDATVAAGFKTAGASATPETPETPTEVTPGKPKPKAPKFIQSASARGLKTGDLIQGAITLKFNKKMAVLGKFTGKREGKSFSISLLGKVQKDGNYRATGKQGSNSVTVTGRANKTSATGQLSGSINKKNFRLRFTAK